jgi:hypothetical protein
MNNKTFKVGDKVKIPTTKFGKPIVGSNISAIVKRANDEWLSYLYVIRIDYKTIVLSDKNEALSGGDYFYASDLELYEESLLEIAKRLYPIGTKYIDVGTTTEKTVKGNFLLHQHSCGTFEYITDGYGGSVYKKKQWAKIINKNPNWWKDLKKGDVVKRISNEGGTSDLTVGKCYTIVEDASVQDRICVLRDDGRYQFSSRYYEDWEFVSKAADVNPSTTDLEQWLIETKAKNLSLEALKKVIGNCSFSQIYCKLQGADSMDKAKILYNLWNKSKEWEPGTWIVITKKYGSLNVGEVHQLREGSYNINESCVNLENRFSMPYKDCCKWFSTKEEAENFSRILTGKVETIEDINTIPSIPGTQGPQNWIEHHEQPKALSLDGGGIRGVVDSKWIWDQHQKLATDIAKNSLYGSMGIFPHLDYSDKWKYGNWIPDKEPSSPKLILKKKKKLLLSSVTEIKSISSKLITNNKQVKL